MLADMPCLAGAATCSLGDRRLTVRGLVVPPGLDSARVDPPVWLVTVELEIAPVAVELR